MLLQENSHCSEVDSYNILACCVLFLMYHISATNKNSQVHSTDILALPLKWFRPEVHSTAHSIACLMYNAVTANQKSVQLLNYEL